MSLPTDQTQLLGLLSRQPRHLSPRARSLVTGLAITCVPRLALGGIWLLAFGLFCCPNPMRDAQIDSVGMRVTANVVSTELGGADTKAPYWLTTYQFTSRQGTKHQGTTRLDFSRYPRGSELRSLEIVYWPDDPNYSRQTGELAVVPLFYFYPASFAILLWSIPATVREWRLRRRTVYLLEHGRATLGTVEGARPRNRQSGDSWIEARIGFKDSGGTNWVIRYSGPSVRSGSLDILQQGGRAVVLCDDTNPKSAMIVPKVAYDLDQSDLYLTKNSLISDSNS